MVDQLRAEEKLAIRVDVDPIEPHDPALGQIAQCDLAFLHIDASKSNYVTSIHQY